MHRVLLVLSAMLLLASACGVNRQVLIRQAGRDLQCTEKEIEYEHIWDTHYEVVGCGQRALYQCPRGDVCELSSKASE